MSQTDAAADARTPNSKSTDSQAIRVIGWTVPTSVLARVLTLIAPYAIGRAYINGWWAGLGLGDWPVDYAIDDYLYLGFVAFANGTGRFAGENFLTYVIAFALGAMAVAVLWTTLDLILNLLVTRTKHWRQRLQQRASRRRKPHPLIKIGQAALGAGVFTLIGIAAWLWVALILVLPVAYAERVGRAEAEHLRDDLNTPQKAHKFPIATLSIPVTTKSTLRLVQCTADWCVVAAGRDVHLVPKSTVAHAGPTALLKERTSPTKTSIQDAPARDQSAAK